MFEVAYDPFNKSVLVCPLSPLGYYPSITFRVQDAALVVTPELVASVVRTSPLSGSETSYSEVESLSPFEVRLLAAVILSVPYGCGVISPYPAQHSVTVKLTADADLSEPSLLDPILNGLKRYLESEDASTRDFHRPPALGGRSYSFNESANDLTRQLEVYNAIDCNDALLIRGLGALIRANMVSCHSELLENACMSLWVALDASMHLIFRVLRQDGVASVTSKDAAKYVHRNFGNPNEAEGYFELYYPGRIMTMHPSSRYGVFPHAPLLADDFYELNEDLIRLYDFLITGFIPKELRPHDSP